MTTIIIIIIIIVIQIVIQKMKIMIILLIITLGQFWWSRPSPLCRLMRFEITSLWC